MDVTFELTRQDAINNTIRFVAYLVHVHNKHMINAHLIKQVKSSAVVLIRQKINQTQQIISNK